MNGERQIDTIIRSASPHLRLVQPREEGLEGMPNQVLLGGDLATLDFAGRPCRLLCVPRDQRARLRLFPVEQKP